MDGTDHGSAAGESEVVSVYRYILLFEPLSGHPVAFNEILETVVDEQKNNEADAIDSFLSCNEGHGLG